ncbi:hypothetical protein [Buttiauxella sp.]|uniref:hypothetical protein n=1 Tax=Buttiauxella sp. TaxID=1972222 RepID=UPI003C772094
MGVMSWFGGETIAASAVGEAVPLTPGQGGGGMTAVDATAANLPDENWVDTALRQALPQILGMTHSKGGSRSAPSAGGAKGVGGMGGGSAASAMQVPDMIGKSANNNPLDDINKWSNLF